MNISRADLDEFGFFVADDSLNISGDLLIDGGLGKVRFGGRLVVSGSIVALAGSSIKAGSSIEAGLSISCKQLSA